MMRIFAALCTNALILFTRLVTAVQARWTGCGPEPVQRIYYANHASHGDLILFWTVLPPLIRKKTRPVAGADYWLKGGIRRFIATNVFRAVLIDRQQTRRELNPITAMSDAIDAGMSLILFPEGTRNTTADTLQPFKSGIYHLARKCPDIELVPVWLANLNRVLPKGEVIPVPLLCTVTFGIPLKIRPEETRADFLARARDELLSLAPNSSPKTESSE